ncbi:MFS transporter [Oceanicoccus sp. KOV_DT_Chl]|uniref:MFS transporter n=1 Tax=Oceanicoccus sp. KOV_DT_Chl TaxID=1904639 RepID=UPI000C7E661D|nr:MFS transporter [Oceanicoccus sp. KOV_DT_Chl]
MNKNLLGIYLVTSLSMAGVFTISPALPAIGLALEISKAEISYLITAFTLGTVLVAPFVGLIADKVGRKKLLVPSLYLFGIAGFCCGLTDSFGWLLFWRFLQGVGSSALGTLSSTMITDIYSGPDRVRYFGYNMSVNSIGMVVFPLLGGALVVFSWRYPFMVSVIAIPIAVYNQIFLRYTEHLTELNTRQYMQNFLRSLTDRRVMLAAYLNFTCFIMMGGAFLTFYALFITENFSAEIIFAGVHLPRELVIGFAMSLFSVMVGLVAFRLGAIHARFGFNRVLAFAFLSYSGAFFLFQSTSHLFYVLLACAWLGLGHGLAAPSLMALHTRLAPAGMTASYLTLNSLVFRLGQTVGPMLMAMVLNGYGLNAVFMVAALIALPAVVVAWSAGWAK